MITALQTTVRLCDAEYQSCLLKAGGSFALLDLTVNGKRANTSNDQEAKMLRHLSLILCEVFVDLVRVTRS